MHHPSNLESQAPGQTAAAPSRLHAAQSIRRTWTAAGDPQQPRRAETPCLHRRPGYPNCTAQPSIRRVGGRPQCARQPRITYWLAPGRRIVLLTVFRKTRSAEVAEVARALQAQKICEAEHGPAHDTFGGILI
jgi:hypothetical protein